MSHPSNRFSGFPMDMMEAADSRDVEASLPITVRSLENDELQALLVVLMREWRERVATSQDNHLPVRLNA